MKLLENSGGSREGVKKKKSQKEEKPVRQANTPPLPPP